MIPRPGTWATVVLPLRRGGTVAISGKVYSYRKGVLEIAGATTRIRPLRVIPQVRPIGSDATQQTIPDRTPSPEETERRTRLEALCAAS